MWLVFESLALTGLLLVTSPSQSQSVTPSELELNHAYCHKISGQTEVRHTYQIFDTRHNVIADCETATHVFEMGLDKRSSLDSLQQATFLAWLTGKTPVVVIFDTDRHVGPYEYRIERACLELGIIYRRIPT
ncbi:MAG: hypothetical protein AAF442_08080 [Pseudomonadota bacterium]